jgi:S-DNA-T family DNA segregation ATPase FtsK/SpoIIIE
MTERTLREIAAVALILGAVLMAVALASHHPMDPSPFHTETAHDTPQNLVGWLGASLSASLLGVFGLSACLFPFLAGILGWSLLRQQIPESLKWVGIGWLLVLMALPGLVGLTCSELAFRGGVLSCGGLIGHAADDLLVGLAGPVGRVIILAFFVIVGLLLISGLSVERGADGVHRQLSDRISRRRKAKEERRRLQQQEEDRRAVLTRRHERLTENDPGPGSIMVKELKGKGSIRINRRTRGSLPDEDAAGLDLPIDRGNSSAAQTKTSSAKRTKAPKPGRKTTPKAKPLQIQEEFDFVEDLDTYDLPRPSFLDATTDEIETDSSALMEIGRMLTDKCQEFKVRGEVINIRTGPVVTTYEFRLASGVKISAVQNLSEDLALALRTPSVRIERIPGRATVGIEVPNPEPEVIKLSKIIDAPEFQRARSLLTLCMGVDIRGNPFVTDLQRAPHLLIGGFTGSGKSVGINAMILSILYKARPDEVKFIFVDPKMVELGVYKDIPHLLTPIITEPKKAANALGWAVDEMDQRYRKLAMLGVRNLEQYNQLVNDPKQLKATCERLLGEGDEDQEFEPMPFIVIIIDELADLMMTAGRAVEDAITRIAQKARAVGLHLICATQRPSVDVLTGIIKANFPCRVAYKVRSRHDSRTILDAIGAEHLIGRGDMLYLPPGTSNIMRIHGPLVTEKEIAGVVRYIKRFGKPDYQKSILTHEPVGGSDRNSGGNGSGDGIESFEDPMYEKAVRLVVTERKASASHIQRRLRLGYTRSARLIDIMEAEGIVGPAAGSKGREILVPENYFAEVDETHALNGDDSSEEA